jgi:hypothetical protein
LTPNVASTAAGSTQSRKASVSNRQRVIATPGPLYNASMATLLLATKLYIPPPRPKVVLCPRLVERLNEGLQRAPGVTLISAPAGFGKTTLVSGCGRPAAWLSLDAGDSAPACFLAYLVAALQTLARPAASVDPPGRTPADAQRPPAQLAWHGLTCRRTLPDSPGAADGDRPAPGPDVRHARTGRLSRQADRRLSRIGCPKRPATRSVMARARFNKPT